MKLFDRLRFKAAKLVSGKLFYTINGTTYSIDLSSSSGVISAYKLCPPVSVVVNRIAKSMSAGIYTVTDLEGNEAKGSRAKQVSELLKKPNPYQTWEEFIIQNTIYKKLYGNAFILALIPVGFRRSETRYLINLPNNLLDFEELPFSPGVDMSEELNAYLKKLTVSVAGKIVPLDKQRVLILNDNSLSFDYSYLSESKLTSLTYPVSNCIAAYKARNTLISKRGAIGILSNRSKDVVSHVPLDPKEKEKIQEDFQNYGLSGDQWQYIITSQDLQWSQIGFPTRDLMLFEEITDDIRAIADAYEYPFELLGNDKGVTYANKQEAKKMLYQDVIIPEASSVCAALSSFLMLDSEGLQIGADFSHLEVLQKSELDAWTSEKVQNEALKIELDAGVITVDEWRQIKGYDNE